jgi:hypothetical protein
MTVELSERLPRSSAAEAMAHLLENLTPAMTPPEVAAAAVLPGPTRYFHTGAPTSLTVLKDWRQEIIQWATDEHRYPEPLSAAGKRSWNVALGERLALDLADSPEAGHPEVHCWLASRLFPDLVVWRWGEPSWSTGPDGTNLYTLTPKSWWRFTTHRRNALRVVWWRATQLGRHVATHALEDEFLAVLGRPTIGADPRVARLVLEELIEQDRGGADDGGNRGEIAKAAMVHLRRRNALRPLRHLSDDRVRAMTAESLDAATTRPERPSEHVQRRIVVRSGSSSE